MLAIYARKALARDRSGEDPLTLKLDDRPQKGRKESKVERERKDL